MAICIVNYHLVSQTLLIKVKLLCVLNLLLAASYNIFASYTLKSIARKSRLNLIMCFLFDVLHVIEYMVFLHREIFK